MSFKPWGNLALCVGVIGFIVLFNLNSYNLVLFAFSFLLLVRVWYRVVYGKDIKREWNISNVKNWRMIVIQIVGFLLFLL